MTEKKGIKILNAVPLGALTEFASAMAVPISMDEVKDLLRDFGVESYIGHQDTANILSNLLGIKIDMNRANASFKRNEFFIVAAYVGQRLPEGATTLPEGAKFRFYKVQVL